MDYTTLKTYNIQLKYIKKIYYIKVNKNCLRSKLLELNKLMETHKDLLDEEDKENIRNDIKMIKEKLEKDELNITKFATLIEHIETLVHCEGNGLEYLDQKPKSTKIWIDRTIEEFEKEYRERLK